MAAGASHAADLQPLNVKPGLWETTTVTEQSGMPTIPAETLAKLPPEQRARIEAQLKASSGAKSNTAQACYTKEDLNRAFWQNDRNKSCKQTVVTSTSSKQEVRLECEISGAKSTGTLTLEAPDSGHVNGAMQMQMGAQARGIAIKINISSKYLNSSCGDVKPFERKD